MGQKPTNLDQEFHWIYHHPRRVYTANSNELPSGYHGDSDCPLGNPDLGFSYYCIEQEEARTSWTDTCSYEYKL